MWELLKWVLIIGLLGFVLFAAADFFAFCREDRMARFERAVLAEHKRLFEGLQKRASLDAAAHEACTAMITECVRELQAAVERASRESRSK